MIQLIDSLYSIRDSKRGVIDKVVVEPYNAFWGEQVDIRYKKNEKTEIRKNFPRLYQEMQQKDYRMEKSGHTIEALNVELYCEALREKGYDAKPLYEELIQVEKEGRVGVTGHRFSSIFCDTATERFYPMKRMMALNGIPLAKRGKV